MNRKGFTLIEIIITIAIIAAIVAIVFVALRPQERLQDAQVTQERQSAEQMTRAINLQIIDSFAIPSGINDGETLDICKAGVSPVDPENEDNDPCISLDNLVSQGYLPDIPETVEYKSNTRISGYQIERSGGYVAVCRRGECGSGGGGGTGPGGGATNGGASSESSSSSTEGGSGPSSSSSSSSGGGGGSSSSSVPTTYVVQVPSDQTVPEGTTLSLTNIGQFFDPETSGDESPYTYAIDWGDGTAQSSGTATIDVAGSGGNPTQGSFDGSHTYADNGDYIVSVTVTSADSRIINNTFSVEVSNVAPTLTVQAPQTFQYLPYNTMIHATFTDPGYNNPLNVGNEVEEKFTYAIDWGDGSPVSSGPPTTIDAQGGPGTPKQGSLHIPHQYAGPGTYTITVTISDDDGGLDMETLSLTLPSSGSSSSQ